MATLKSQETIAPNHKKVTVQVDKPQFDEAVDKAYRKASKNITVPGFRKGKAPRHLIEKMYGKGVFYEDAVNDLLPDVYEDILKETVETVVSRPDFDIETIDENGLTLTATFFVKPDIDVSDYKGIALERPVMPVTDKDIENELERVQNRNSRTIDVTDRPAEMGDTVVFDFEGFTDGKPFEGGKAEKHSLKLGSNQFIPGFEEQIVGKNIGEEFEVSVTFPEDYHAEELKGKPAVFKCLIHSISNIELPEIDDELAKDVSEFDTLEEYKESIRKDLEKHNAEHADSHVSDDLVKVISEKVVGDIPECMFENETENMVRDYENNLRMNGLDLDTFFKYTGQTIEDLKKQVRPSAETQVKSRLAFEKIAKLENLTATDEEIEEEYSKIAEAYSMPLENVKKAVEASQIAEDIKVRKAVDFVKENAVITDVEHTHDHDHGHDDHDSHDED